MDAWEVVIHGDAPASLLLTVTHTPGFAHRKS